MYMNEDKNNTGHHKGSNSYSIFIHQFFFIISHTLSHIQYSTYLETKKKTVLMASFLFIYNFYIWHSTYYKNIFIYINSKILITNNIN